MCIVKGSFAKIVRMLAAIAVMCAAIGTILPESAHAAEQGIFIKGRGGWSLHPYAALLEFYDDNPSRNPSGQEDGDFITVGRTGFRIMNPGAAEGRRARFYADLYGDWLYYAKSERKGLRPSLDLKFDYVSGTGFEFNLFDLLTVSDAPQNNELTGLALSVVNAGQARIKYAFNRVAFSVAYRNDLIYYANHGDINNMTHSFIPSMYVKLSPMTELVAEYTYGLVSYDKNDSTHSDANYQQLQGGLNWKPTPKIDVALRAGYQRRDYDDPAFGDYSGWVGSLALDWTILQASTSLKLHAERMIVESIYATNNFYTSNGGGLTFRHRFGERVLLTLDGGWYLDLYPESTTEGSVTQKREDKIWMVGASLDYYFVPGLSIGTSYSYRARDSNFDVFDYNENQVKMLQIAAVF